MAYLATKRFTYGGQLGVFIGFLGVGFILAGVASIVPLLSQLDLKNVGGNSSSHLMDKLLKPENANLLRWIQFLSTFFLFFLPPVLYALVVHKKPFVHLGFKNKVNPASVGLVVLIVLASLPMVAMLQDLTEMLPWSKATRLAFKAAEDSYNQQVAVIARMDNFWDYIISVIMIALLPAVFEEVLFRGALQNLLSRWTKMPIFSIIITAIIFSAIHGSYLGFLSRFALGFVLGWLFYRTGNIWLNIVAHFFNNGFAITALYLTTKPGVKPDPSKIEDHFPLWIGLVSVAVVYYLLTVFDNVSRNEIDRPGEEVPLPGVQYTNDPFETYTYTIKDNSQ